MKYAKIKNYDVANGPGIRTTLFVSGCTHNCKGCFNKEQQDFNYGNKFDFEIASKFLNQVNDEKIVGVNILGGEPLQQTMDCSLTALLMTIRYSVGKSIWLWTGYTFEEAIKDPKMLKIIRHVDVLIDGRFEEDKKDVTLMYRGSSNQRIIDVQKSLENNRVILYDINSKQN